jgi:two-component system, OmpR family, response regulator
LTGVLLAEDDRTIGELMNAAFTDGSYRVDWVLDGESALSGFETHTNYVCIGPRFAEKKWGYRFGRNSHEEPSGARTGDNSVRCLRRRVQGLDDGAATTY